ncbi:site-specific integrase [Kordiimonas sp. SCSIO 12610]|uniref:site-specific integrase n=1 Tax=Kordiimonas sp. SCSIO 12610 TaxID=2829597 RepID=UPI0021099632|nr:site-specific integrase [Kordiimonas sp. SCSIO 12610]UTW54610.1 tyrosine-type recombinase/integrase [Kordiimonas sp. SCSIO 12610]
MTSDNLPLSDRNQHLHEDAKDYIANSLSDNTLNGYRSDLEHYIAWGGKLPATPEMVANYLSDYADSLSVATLSRRIAALSKIHELKKHPSPTKTDIVRSVMAGIRRKHSKPQRQASPITKERLFMMLDTCDKDIKGIRDRAILLIGFTSAMRRSELIGLDRKDLEFVPEGVIITIERSKTDQEGQGQRIAIPFAKGDQCAVKALKTYLTTAQIEEGPIFRSMNGNNLWHERMSSRGLVYIIKARAKAAGMDPSYFSGHSLRAGFVTTAAHSSVSTWQIMEQTRHKSEATLRRYIREANLFKKHALDGIL